MRFRMRFDVGMHAYIFTTNGLPYLRHIKKASSSKPIADGCSKFEGVDWSCA
jgi:hypothetical protein